MKPCKLFKPSLQIFIYFIPEHKSTFISVWRYDKYYRAPQLQPVIEHEENTDFAVVKQESPETSFAETSQLIRNAKPSNSNRNQESLRMRPKTAPRADLNAMRPSTGSGGRRNEYDEEQETYVSQIRPATTRPQMFDELPPSVSQHTVPSTEETSVSSGTESDSDDDDDARSYSSVGKSYVGADQQNRQSHKTVIEEESEDEEEEDENDNGTVLTENESVSSAIKYVTDKST